MSELIWPALFGLATAGAAFAGYSGVLSGDNQGFARVAVFALASLTAISFVASRRSAK